MSFQSVGAIVPGLLRDFGLEEGIAGWRAVEEWGMAVGPRIARRTRAVGFRDGALRVEVASSAWMYELEFLKRDLLRRLHERLGSARVRELRFVLAGGRIQE